MIKMPQKNAVALYENRTLVIISMHNTAAQGQREMIGVMDLSNIDIWIQRQTPWLKSFQNSAPTSVKCGRVRISSHPLKYGPMC